MGPTCVSLGGSVNPAGFEGDLVAPKIGTNGDTCPGNFFHFAMSMGHELNFSHQQSWGYECGI